MNKTIRYVLWVISVLFVLLMLWYFLDIVVYIVIAAVLSIIGRPLVKKLDKIHIGRFKIPHGLNAFLTLLLMMLLLISFIMLIVPLFVQQADLISQIDKESLGTKLEQPAAEIEVFMHKYGALKPNENVEDLITDKLESIVNLGAFSNLFRNVLGFTGSFFMGAFSVLFLLFFFLKDDRLVINIFLAFVPEGMTRRSIRVMKKVKTLLTRYFVGLCIEITSMITLLITGLSIFGVSNAFLIGFLGGLMNVIPYLGPIIGASVGTVLALIAALSLGIYVGLGWTAITVLGVFLAANLVDNVLLQPLIYSNSVKAHPIEIFLVIIMAGSLAGIPGMILAIPSYTVLRILAKEFFGDVRFVQKLTNKI